ncbi:MAG: 4-(cytidine 5'-diphospho)-2-C-methyl-D-erythritol kinase [Crocinitomicaceae bacterium]
MISFPNAKINIGLQVLGKRKDGYHSISSLVYPIPLKDVLEIIPSVEYSFHQYGKIRVNPKDNLIEKAFQIVKKEFGIPNIEIHLIKNIPLGSGLGGGSSNAVFTLKMLNTLFELNISPEKLRSMALKLGSDCPFFIENTPQIIEGRGEICSHSPSYLEGKWLLLALPDIQIATETAYSNIQFSKEKEKLKWDDSIENWKTTVVNDFQEFQFQNHPFLFQIYEEIDLLSEYTSLTGTGSSIYGIFNQKIPVNLHCESIWLRL